jgi:hypothetical protein
MKFDMSHNTGGFKEFFQHIERLENSHQLQVAVAIMTGRVRKVCSTFRRFEPWAVI